MAIRIGDEAPNFNINTTEGEIDFHNWIGNSWAILFSHPKDFTPVCTTELEYVAKLKPEFDKKNTKVIGLSTDSVEDHQKWVGDIAETQGYEMNFPLIGDENLVVSKLYDMIHPVWPTHGKREDITLFTVITIQHMRWQVSSITHHLNGLNVTCKRHMMQDLLLFCLCMPPKD